MSVPNAPISLDDKYDRTAGRIFLSGTQALVRLPLMQKARDAAAGLNTAGYISGYRGSPLGIYDLQLNRERRRLQQADIRFEPGVNEDLAATAIWGTQQLTLLPGAKFDGVFSIWYGKGPGVDRSGDPIKHGNRMGVSKHGGVLVVFGDDHPGKSSTISHHSEPALAANGVPVLYPATVQEYLDLGLHGFAMSRYAGIWVGFKTVNETLETSSTVEVGPERVTIVTPGGGAFPPDGVHARYGFDPIGDEMRLVRFKLPLAQAYARENGLDRVTHGGSNKALGIVAAGKSWSDVVHALTMLGLDAARLERLGVSVYKPALIWPLEPVRLTQFALAQRELLFVEEKAAFMEPQAAHVLFNLEPAKRPRIVGKRDEQGREILPSDVVLEPLQIALLIGARLRSLGLADPAVDARLAMLGDGLTESQQRDRAPTVRTPYFCSGCPHNSSTKVPDGSLAMAGIGCHTMAIYMDRKTSPPTQMGGEGMNWTGIAPFSSLPHVFQNLGDGTYFHSGLLSIRGAVTSGVNITYKILYNDAVAMTGGQTVEGGLSVADITHQLRAERVQRIAVVSDDILKYGSAPGFAAHTTVHHRDDLDEVQRELRGVPGVSAIIYDQTCAAEKRRRRKRGTFANPDRRVLINELVCEGCGDCSAQANCVSIEPVETEFGRKRKIDQSSCNKDYSCVKGFCPSFVTVEGAALKQPRRESLPSSLVAALPEPPARDGAEPWNVLVTGIGGTGVVTVGAVLGMAAHLDGLAASVYDVTGLAQKGGAVMSHIKVAANPADLSAARVGVLEANLLLGCDLVVAASADVLRSIDSGRTHAVINTHLVPTAKFQLNPDIDFEADKLLSMLGRLLPPGRREHVDANSAALRFLGDTLGTNMFMVGYALQKGWLPVSRGAVERAIELNAAAVPFNLQALALGRLAADDPMRFSELVGQPGHRDGADAGSTDAARAGTDATGTSDDTDVAVAVREKFLADYQNAAYAARFRALVDRVAQAEASARSGCRQLTHAVARGYFKLLAYKDEYEVARLHSGDALRSQLDATFEPGYRLRFHLAPPGLSGGDAPSGAPRKREYGGWIMPLFGLLAQFKFLRGTVFDPFGHSAERRRERQAIEEYETLITGLLADLSSERHALAVQLAGIPEQIRGFGHVKAASIARAKVREADLLSQWRTGRGSQPAVTSAGAVL